MFTKNIFNTKKDPIAEAIANIAEADYKAKMEELKGQQHKLDKNKNNKLDSDDFKILRGEKKAVKEDAEQTDEAVSPFDWKNRPSELKKKPGELTGHDSKKTTTGTVYTKKAPKPEKDDVKEEVEAIDEKDELSMRVGINRVNKKPREGQKDLSNVPAGNRPGSKNAFTDSDVKRQPDQLKSAIKSSLGKHTKPNLPEEVEQIEAIDERELTPDEVLSREKNVKGMKKSLAGFKARYGDRAKSVMYATATKQAKKD